MASTFVTVPRPFLVCKTSTCSSRSLSQQKIAGLRRNSLRINAISKKWEPTKVVPQADRVLIRLEDLPEKSSGGVLLPKSAVKFERYLMGEVLSVGAEVGEVDAGKKAKPYYLIQKRYTDLFVTDAVNTFFIPKIMHVVLEIYLNFMPLLQVLFSDINAYEVDLGTDAKHCFCKAGDLLAVVE